MAGVSETAIASGRLGKAGDFAGKLAVKFAFLLDLFKQAFETEAALRRPFLWLPVAAGAGVVLYLYADREPSLWFVAPAAVTFGVLAYLARASRIAFFLLCGLCALFAGELSAALRTARVAAPVLDRIKIVTLQGFIEEMDFRRTGARFLLRVHSTDGLAPDQTPIRVRLSTRRAPPFEAGTYVSLKARLLPPARASLPGGYDFARDAWFAQLGAVGNVLGRIEVVAAPVSPGIGASAMMAIDRGRNALARRIDAIVGGDSGAIAAAMVTGKRDLLSDEAKEIIREAGIFHIITISGVQMTLVAAIFFVGLRRLLALSQTLALAYPIKKWAALFAIAGAIFYDIATGSRVGTERALFMTVIMLTSVLLDRQALTMRNLAIAAALVILIQPEAILGASFQLSFAAVAALVAVYEARMSAAAQGRAETYRLAARPVEPGGKRIALASFKPHLARGLLGLLFATFCATSATASFMAYNFHELSPYVLIGNPLTLLVIETFAVPGALLGTLLYPLGLDAFVWRYVGFGIDGVMWAARTIGSFPGSTIHLPAFAPWAIVFLSLAVLSSVLWRTAILRATALPLAVLGLLGAAAGPSFDMAVAPTGDAVAYRAADGRLAVIGRGRNVFTTEQWLRADADGRQANEALTKASCDKLGCTGTLTSGQTIALVFDRAAFAEDCTRADIIVTPFFAPMGCAAGMVIDRDKLKETGALTLSFVKDSFGKDGVQMRVGRAPDEDRPWSPAPKRHWGRAAPPPAAKAGDGQAPGDEPEPAGDTDDQTLE
jgi:competence protein ComEC